jgi:hypothetical protein
METITLRCCPFDWLFSPSTHPAWLLFLLRLSLISFGDRLGLWCLAVVTIGQLFKLIEIQIAHLWNGGNTFWPQRLFGSFNESGLQEQVWMGTERFSQYVRMREHLWGPLSPFPLQTWRVCPPSTSGRWSQLSALSNWEPTHSGPLPLPQHPTTDGSRTRKARHYS